MSSTGSSGAAGGGSGPNKLASLRAMFEQKNKDDSASTSPPDRGRSSGVESAASSRTGASPRPLSKVRTSFIAVGGAAGLARRDSNNSSDNTLRRSAFSMDTDTNPKEMADTKESLNVEMDARKNSAVISETIPENAIETPSVSTPAQDPMEKVKTNGTPINGKPAAGSTLNGNGTTREKASLRKSSEGRTSLKPAPVLVSTSKGANGAKSPRISSGPVKPTTMSAKPVAKTPTSTTKTKAVPAPISTKKTISTAPKPSPRPPAKSPLLPKTPTTPKAAVPKQSPSKTAAPAAAASKLTKTPEKKASKSSLTSNTSSKSPAASHKSPAASQKSKEGGSPGASAKPKPKSPTKPLRLPSSLTAPTASSRSKVSSTAAPPPARSQSRAAGSATPSVGLRRSQSVVKKSAIGPPPVKTQQAVPARPRTSVGGAQGAAHDGRPKSSLSHAAPTGSFLARMMKPTASSQSKTNDKAPASPPRKTQGAKKPVGGRLSGSRPSTRDSTSGQNAFGGSPRAVVSKAHASKPAEEKKVAPKTASVKAQEEHKAADTETVDADIPETEDVTTSENGKLIAETHWERPISPPLPHFDEYVKGLGPCPEDDVLADRALKSFAPLQSLLPFAPVRNRQSTGKVQEKDAITKVGGEKDATAKVEGEKDATAKVEGENVENTEVDIKTAMEEDADHEGVDEVDMIGMDEDHESVLPGENPHDFTAPATMKEPEEPAGWSKMEREKWVKLMKSEASKGKRGSVDSPKSEGLKEKRASVESLKSEASKGKRGSVDSLKSEGSKGKRGSVDVGETF